MKYLQAFETKQEEFEIRKQLTRKIFEFLQIFNIRKLNLGSAFTIKIGSTHFITINEFNDASIGYNIRIQISNIDWLKNYVSSGLIDFLLHVLNYKETKKPLIIDYSEVDEIVSQLTKENYDFYIDTRKYNL